MAKDSRQIARWLKEQDWHDRWFKNLEESFKAYPQAVKSFVRGHEGKNTITRAFIWWHTPEGGNFWEEVDYLFKRWYEGREQK